FIGEQLGFTLTAAGEWNFVYSEAQGKYQYITNFGKESDMIMADSLLFENRQTFFSHRGFIWSRTLPLLKEHFFLGSGPDTFLLVYPQEEYLMMQQHGFENSVMTKPHSLYLQVGVQTGVLSLLCLLVFYGWYAVWSIRLYCFRNVGTLVEGFGIAAFIGSIGYMISGISNDSMVTTAPVFWCMIGLGVAANAMTVKQRKQKE
ncbi:MAG: O-antigen ligase family protein, partial [Lachnospiraceae bacterium]